MYSITSDRIIFNLSEYHIESIYTVMIFKEKHWGTCVLYYCINNKRHGLYESWHKNVLSKPKASVKLRETVSKSLGQLFTKYNYVDGKINGLYESWYNNGQLMRRMNYVDGKKHGPCLWWEKNGQLDKNYIYVNGKKHGLYENWDTNGKLWKKYHYVNGKKIRIKL